MRRNNPETCGTSPNLWASVGANGWSFSSIAESLTHTADARRDCGRRAKEFLTTDGHRWIRIHRAESWQIKKRAARIRAMPPNENPICNHYWRLPKGPFKKRS